jgi:16S rRNA (adenine1518-N6/adenine1519-N6)-dimethyltransferase
MYNWSIKTQDNQLNLRTATIPKKALGQHWLLDETVLENIVDALEAESSDTILEIGPGKGALTKHLLGTAAKVVAIEKDDSLVPGLLQLSSSSKITVLGSDVREFDFSGLPADYLFASNLPYYISGEMFRLLTEVDNKPKTAVLLIQKEVAQRIAAKPGDYSMLGLAVQDWYEVSLGEIVGPENFDPQPKVDSQVIILKRRSISLLGDSEKEVFRLAKAGFLNRRKTLVNGLSPLLNISKSEASALLTKSSINPSARAQELSFDQWLALVSVV